MRTQRLPILLVALSLLGGCSDFRDNARDTGRDHSNRCIGKCDEGRGSDALTPEFEVDLAGVNAQWPDDVPAASVEDLFRVRVIAGPRTLIADTHLFGDAVNIIPYSDDDGITDAAGNQVAYGDAVIAQYFPPGEVGIAVKHHRPAHRTLALAGGPASAMKEHMKLQDTHIELVVGVERGGRAAAITLNNPQSYQDGRFGDASYPMIFLQPVYPSYLSTDQAHAFRDNIRTMLVGFNAVSNFPGDYNGGDPLAARTPRDVREHVAMMVRAITGDEEAREWFRREENQVYCAELAHISFSSGLIVPLNAEHLVPLVGEETWQRFQHEVSEHNAGRESAFTSLNSNGLVADVRLSLAAGTLLPASSYAPEGSDAAERLAFEPMTMADIVQYFVATHMPRRELGEATAPLQGAALMAMKPGLLEAMTLDRVPLVAPADIANAPAAQQPALEARAMVEDLFGRIVAVVSTPHANYSAFRAALDPLMAEARLVTGPRDGSGTGLFVPPSLMHLVAQGRHTGGIMGLRYVGHGLHYSLVRPRGSAMHVSDAGSMTLDAGMPETPAPTSSVLVERSGVLAAGSSETIEITAPAGTTRLRFELEASAGDPDLYVRRNAAPTTSAYDCRPYRGAGEAEDCQFAPPGEDTFHVMVHGYDDGAAFRLRVVAE